MITIDLGKLEYYDSDSNQFHYEEGGVVRFEYSLKVLYQWEGKWKKPFLKGELTGEEAIDFYMMMALDPFDEKFLSSKVVETLSNYIGDSNTATTFSSNSPGQNGNNSNKRAKIYTAEEIYALMFMSQVPLEMENINLNRLMVILRIIDNYNQPPKKMSKQDIYKQNAQLNAQRRQKFKSKG